MIYLYIYDIYLYIYMIYILKMMYMVNMENMIKKTIYIYDLYGLHDVNDKKRYL